VAAGEIKDMEILGRYTLSLQGLATVNMAGAEVVNGELLGEEVLIGKMEAGEVLPGMLVVGEVPVLVGKVELGERLAVGKKMVGSGEPS